MTFGFGNNANESLLFLKKQSDANNNLKLNLTNNNTNTSIKQSEDKTNLINE
jgi:hypothetical protein